MVASNTHSRDTLRCGFLMWARMTAPLSDFSQSVHHLPHLREAAVWLHHLAPEQLFSDALPTLTGCVNPLLRSAERSHLLASNAKTLSIGCAPGGGKHADVLGLTAPSASAVTSGTTVASAGCSHSHHATRHDPQGVKPQLHTLGYVPFHTLPIPPSPVPLHMP